MLRAPAIIASANALWRSAVVLTVAVLLPCVIPANRAAAGDLTDAQLDSILVRNVYSTFRQTTGFLVGCVKEDGGTEVNKAEVIDFLKLRLRNSISPVPILGKDSDVALYGEACWVVARIWVVGDSYPLAYHVELVCGPTKNMDAFQTAHLGYCSSTDLEEVLKEVLESCVDRFAVAFFKGRGEF